MRYMLREHSIRELLSLYYPLFAILIGVILISLAMGPYQTLDTQLEYNTTRGVIRWGYPYLDRFGEPHNDSYGDLFNIPPLGFYIQALFLTIFGATVENGIALTTMFGLASTIIVYRLGKELYSESTGIFAAALFALTPWQLILTRAFLVDAQCLFLSLLYLYFGILAIQKESTKLATVSGVFFAAAFLTKQYAIFMLIPLLLFYVYQRPKNPKRILSQLITFSLPIVFSNLLWYQIILGKDLLYLFSHNDFKDLNFPEVAPSYSFVTNFLKDYGLGIFFVAAVIFSLTIGLLFWKQIQKKTVKSDLICLITIVTIIGVDLYLAVNLNLKAPYTSAIKYIYQSLPFFSLVAASLAHKSISLIKVAKQSAKFKKVLLISVSVLGIVLLAVSIIANMNTAQKLATTSYLIFRVQPGQDVGYSFYVLHPLSQGDPRLIVQFFGFAMVSSGILWRSRNFIRNSFNQTVKVLSQKRHDSMTD
ncbi:glycosyltransferase family 39 protein [Candidatus Bathyarchaeota archaeon]|nr:glycosyltransferase family 39 protein [Candidatus Bathyarchaeota archaeon]